jgi:hypothetical protein
MAVNVLAESIDARLATDPLCGGAKALFFAATKISVAIGGGLINFA